MITMREESDSVGVVEVPADKLWGALILSHRKERWSWR